MHRHAIAADGTGGPEVLTGTDDTLPAPGPGHVLVRVRLAGVNFWDVMQRRGAVPLPPDRIPGVEGVGVVEEVGDGVALTPGTRVAWSKVPSSYANVVVAPASNVVAVPDALSDEQAAGLIMQGVTAEYLSNATTSLGSGDTAVVTAAAGGVGRLLTLMLRARGVHVIGVVGSEPKRAVAVADDVLVESADTVASVRALAPSGVQAVFDAAGGDVSPLFGMLAPRGIAVLYGAAGGPVSDIPAGLLASGSFYVTRTAGRDYTAAPGEWEARVAAVFAAAVSGTLTACISRVAALDEAADVHRALESRATTGKILLRP